MTPCNSFLFNFILERELAMLKTLTFCYCSHNYQLSAAHTAILSDIFHFNIYDGSPAIAIT